MLAEAPALLLRADAGPGIGSGHVARMLALAEAWIDAGGRATLLTVAPSKPLAVRAGALGVFVRRIPASFPNSADLTELLAAIAAEKGEKPWVAVDGYGFDAAYLRAARDAGAHLLMVDDVPRLDDYPVDVLLNQNAGAEKAAYPLSSGILPLMGPRWALLRPDFAKKDSGRKVRAEASKLLVSFGGADSDDASGLAIKALKRLKRRFEAVLVVGPDNPRGAELERSSIGTTIRVEKAANMPALMADADLALLGGGVTMLEACAAGLPSLVATVAANQEPGAAALAERGAVRLLGAAASLSEEMIAAELEVLMSDRSAAEALACNGLDAVDGRGAARVAAILLALAAPRMTKDWVRMRSADRQDSREIWRIANDRDVRDNSLDKRPIPWVSHEEWFSDRLSDSKEFLFVADVGCVAGHFRLSAISPSALEVHFYVHPAFRGRGLGTLLLTKAQEIAFSQNCIDEVVGNVLPGNISSIKAFTASGFSCSCAAAPAGHPCLEFRSVRKTAVPDDRRQA